MYGSAMQSIVRLWVTLSGALLIVCTAKPENDFSGGNLAQDFALMNLTYCAGHAAKAQASRTFVTGFENLSDFNGFYISPSPYQTVDTHGFSSAQVHGGGTSHLASISGAVTQCAAGSNCNHRGYPTIQLSRSSQGSFSGTIFVEFYTYASFTLSGTQQWISLATLTSDPSDAWMRTVLINVDGMGLGSTNLYTNLYHVPYQGQGERTYQASSSNGGPTYPMNQWVKISACVNFDPANGWAKVWQNDVLVSAAPVLGGCGNLEQAHFGLYAQPTVNNGTIYNDDLQIREVAVCPK